MLIDKQGRIVDPDKLPKGRAKREAALVELREVPGKWRGHANYFTLGARARLREAKR